MQPQTPIEVYIHAYETMDTSAQIRMLYESAIQYVSQAKIAIEENDHDTRYQKIDKTISIIRGLRLCLDFSASEEVTLAMDRYYEALYTLLISLQYKPDKKLCDNIIENLTTIKITWENIQLSLLDIKKADDEEPEETNTRNFLI